MKQSTILIWGSRVKPGALLALFMGLVVFVLGPGAASSGPLLESDDFILAAPQGFGDRQNGWAWSMQWWNGHLYVGTNRAWHCAETAALNLFLPNYIPYPPLDPDVECTPDPEDLPLQAEIWRWTPATNTWERVYQSPNDVPLLSGKLVARDVGYRGMTIFEESVGTNTPVEIGTLYVTGVSPKFIYDAANNLPPPRILRSTDGLNFEPVPQDPGTALGDFPFGSLRGPVSYKGRLYVIGGSVQGSGVLLEAENPAGGNDNFRIVSPPGMIVSTAQSYNGFLYVGVRSVVNGYSVVKTDAIGLPPYNYTTVIDKGGYLEGPARNPEVLSMKVFNGRLYVGGNGILTGSIGPANAAELVRINPDDTWDVVVGYPRITPDGPKFPISGLLAGFENPFNVHMWRMEVFDENLYVGTFDTSTTFKEDPIIEPNVRDLMGFDLYGTSNGTDFVPVTTNGFGDKFNFGARTLTATPHGLFLGTANYYYGLQVWRSQIRPDPKVYLPLIMRNSTDSSSSPTSMAYSSTVRVSGLQPPSQVGVEIIGDGTVVSWEPVVGATQYHVFRSETKTIPLLISPTVESLIEAPNMAELSSKNIETSLVPQQVQALIPLRALEIGTTTDFYFVDGTAESGTRYIYHIEASDGSGRRSDKSNIAAASALAPAVTFNSLTASLAEIRKRGYLTPSAESEIAGALATAQALSEDGDYAGAALTLANLREHLEGETQILMTSWKAEDLARVLAKLERRIHLVQVGIVHPSDLY